MARVFKGSGVDTTTAAGILKASARQPLANPIMDPTNLSQDAFGRGTAGQAMQAAIAAKTTPTAPTGPTGDGGQTGGGAGSGAGGPADLTSGSSGQSAAQQWTLENDPTYQMGMLQGQSAFNTARANALANMQNKTTGLNRQYAGIEQNAQIARRNLAGNFAARGMGRGDYGAQYRAMDQMNAQEIAAQTDVKDQIASLNQDFLSNFGKIGTDWTGTTAGQEYRNNAIQQALAARLAQYGVQ
jgi:hypothetical protein